MWLAKMPYHTVYPKKYSHGFCFAVLCCGYTLTDFPIYISRAGVLVLGTRTHSTRVLNFWYSYCTRTREFQSHSTRICTRTRGQVLRYSYEYWHEYWYSMVHLRCKGVNHQTCEINSMTYHKGKVPNWLIYFAIIWIYDTWDVITNSKPSFNFIIIAKINWITNFILSFIQVQSLIQLLVNIWKIVLQT